MFPPSERLGAIENEYGHTSLIYQIQDEEQAITVFCESGEHLKRRGSHRNCDFSSGLSNWWIWSNVSWRVLMAL